MRRCLFIILFTMFFSMTALAVAVPTTHKTATSPPKKTVAAPKKHSASPHIPTNMWTLIASNFSLSHYASAPDVEKQIKWFQANPKYFLKIANQGQPYIYYIYQQVKKRNLPGELVLLPMIESAYDPFAYSWVGAAGLWQMMPATGANFGLKQDWWYDGRKDIISSTNAALDYLTYLQTFFNGDWPLAIAAYNSGEGTVQNAIDRNAKGGLDTHFESLRLPLETENYVPRLMALAAIINNPSKYGITLPPLYTGQYFSVLSLPHQIDLSVAAKMADIKLSTLYELNPGYSRWATDPKGPYRLLLPISATSQFEAAYSSEFSPRKLVASSHETRQAILASTQPQTSTAATPLNPVEESIVKASPTTLATAPFGGNTQQTKNLIQTSSMPTQPQASQTQTSRTPTQPQTLQIQTSRTPTQPQTPQTKTTPASKTGIIPLGKGITIHYKVKKGDTLWNIAKRFDVTPGQLRTWNKLSERQKVQIGQTLEIEKITK
ncbi:MAG: transglycosylase SLT domain-containing protein [Gammaproteobacteria bacterium]|nr:transglycosylase SLT domain-containing protein [Gammaproteobacteria bacterium]